MQHELGTKKEGHHIQGFITAATKKRPSTLGNQFQVQPEAFQLMQKNSTPQKNRAYCTDDSKRKAGTEFFEYGVVPGEVPNKLEAICAIVKEHGMKRAWDADPSTCVRHSNGLPAYELHCKRQKTENRIDRPMTVFVITGDSGSGKTHWARHFDPGNSWPLPDIDKGSRLNIDGYADQRTLIIEDYEGEIPYRTFLKLLDKFNFEPHTKGAYFPANWNYVIVTSNIHPTEWYDNKKDPWYYDKNRIGALQRRITQTIDARGIYPNSLFSWTDPDTNKLIERHPDQMALLANMLQTEPEPVAEARQSPIPASNAVPSDLPPIGEHDQLLRDLNEDWERQDNTFETNGGQHTEDPDGTIDGGPEPERVTGIDLDLADLGFT